MARIVHRPEPPTDDAAAAAKPKLTPEEVRALLAVDRAARPSPLKRSAKRSVILLPVGLLSLLFHLAFGEYAWIAEVAIMIAALVWMAKPLFGDRDGWA